VGFETASRGKQGLFVRSVVGRYQRVLIYVIVCPDSTDRALYCGTGTCGEVVLRAGVPEEVC